LIIATGSFAKRLDIPGTGDQEFWQKGVSSCAVCDGAAPIFRDKDLFVIGGGDTAAEEALFLTRYAKKVYIVHRRDVLRASKIMADRVKAHPKVEILWNQEVIKVLGDTLVRSVITQDIITKKEQVREAAGLFFAIGHKPNTEFLQNQLKMDETGYLIVKKNCLTSKRSVFAAGDVQDPKYRQAIVAAGSGCMAAMDAEKWLVSKGF
jgi:thioredoxin reductase (NADPH)